MIRTVLALFIGAVALCAYIINQQPDRQAAIPLPMAVTEGDVARAASAPLLPEGLTAVAEPVVPTPTPLAPTAPVTIAAPMPAPEPKPTIAIDETDLMITTANILAGLGLQVDTRTLAQAENFGTADVLAGLGVIEGADLSKPTPNTALELMVVDMLQRGVSDAEINTQVNAAALAGDIAVPEILVTSQGRVDTTVLLDAIVTTARSATTGIAPAVPDVPTGAGTGVEVRVVQRVDETEQYRFYTVAQGDSLGRIAAKFYGDALKYQYIFEANRGLLSSPDQIKTGQRLAIPALPEV